MENGNNRDGSPESPALGRSRSRSHSHQRSKRPASRSRSRSREHRRKRGGSESPRRSSHYAPAAGGGYPYGSSRAYGAGGGADFRGSRYGSSSFGFGGYPSRYGGGGPPPRSSRGGGYYESSHNGHRETPPEGRCLGVFGLCVDTNEKKLKKYFEEFGGLEDIQLVYDAKTGRSRGFAFIYFESVNSAKHAKEKLNGIEIDGRKIRVDFSLTQHAHTPTPGIYMGRNGASSRGRPYYGGHSSRYDYPRDYYSESRERYPPIKRRFSRSRSRSPRRAGFHSYGDEKSFSRRYPAEYSRY